MFTKYILAIDQGTTGSTVLIFNRAGQVVSRAYQEFRQYYPEPGWVEHDPHEIWEVTLATARKALQQAGFTGHDIAAIGITNQRETTVVWERTTGKPICNAIVWQCRRTAPLCEEMKQAGLEQLVKESTGLVIDAYFSATKLAWILDTIPGARSKAENGELLFGTIETWLLWNLTGGKVHLTDCTNASRTMLYNIHLLRWEPLLLRYLNIPEQILPACRGCSEIYGMTDASLFGCEIPVAGMAGDQQAALFGQTCFLPGEVKSTYGTGCFMLMNTGQTPVHSSHGLLTTIGWSLGGKVTYALEGSIFVAGAAVQWLRDELKIIDHSSESEKLALSVNDNEGVYIVPAFVGLGAPYWDMYARGTITGITRGTGRGHLARAVLESIAYQVHDILQVMSADATLSLSSLKADGGASSNNFLMQFQSDILGVKVERPSVVDSTAAGAAYLAGLAAGFWKDQQNLQEIRSVDCCFQPTMDTSERLRLLGGWKKAVQSARTCTV